jgi:hypothetical protein
MGAQGGGGRLAGQAAAQQRAAASEDIKMRRTALRNAEQGEGATYPNYRDASRRMRGMGQMNTSDNRY